MRVNPRNNKDAAVARPRGTTATNLRLVADKASTGSAESPSSRPDPRLVELVRLLARRAARDFVRAETEGRKRDHLPD